MTKAKHKEAALYGTVDFFIERHHAEIAAVIRRALGRQYNHKNVDREAMRLWVFNDPGLYAMAVAEGMQE